jgi:hypothetical protein
MELERITRKSVVEIANLIRVNWDDLWREVSVLFLQVHEIMQISSSAKPRTCKSSPAMGRLLQRDPPGSNQWVLGATCGVLKDKGNVEDYPELKPIARSLCAMITSELAQQGSDLTKVEGRNCDTVSGPRYVVQLFSTSVTVIWRPREGARSWQSGAQLSDSSRNNVSNVLRTSLETPELIWYRASIRSSSTEVCNHEISPTHVWARFRVNSKVIVAHLDRKSVV